MKLFSQHEKRLALRRKWRSKIILEDEFGEGLIYLYSRDISLGGLYLEQPPSLKMGSHLFLSFMLPGKKKPVRVTGQVIRFIEHGTKPSLKLQKARIGAGIRFVDLDSSAMQQLSQFLQEK